MDAVRLEAALGHKQELVRNFGLWSVTSLGIVIAKSVWLIFSLTTRLTRTLVPGLQLVGRLLLH